MATAEELEECLKEARDAGFRRLIVDLRGLDFMDSTGLTLLTRWTLSAQRDGYDSPSCPGTSRSRRLFELTGLERAFHVRR